jgi:hypothetical protein
MRGRFAGDRACEFTWCFCSASGGRAAIGTKEPVACPDGAAFWLTGTTPATCAMGGCDGMARRRGFDAQSADCGLKRGMLMLGVSAFGGGDTPRREGALATTT